MQSFILSNWHRFDSEFRMAMIGLGIQFEADNLVYADSETEEDSDCMMFMGGEL